MADDLTKFVGGEDPEEELLESTPVTDGVNQFDNDDDSDRLRDEAGKQLKRENESDKIKQNEPQQSTQNNDPTQNREYMREQNAPTTAEMQKSPAGDVEGRLSPNGDAANTANPNAQPKPIENQANNVNSRVSGGDQSTPRVEGAMKVGGGGQKAGSSVTSNIANSSKSTATNIANGTKKAAQSTAQATKKTAQATAQATKKTAEVAAKAVVKGAQLVAKGVAFLIKLGPWGWLILGIIIALIGFVIFLSISVSGILGSTPFQNSEANSRLELLQDAGSITSKRQLDAQDIPQLNSMMDKLIVKAQAKNDTEVVGWCNEIKTKLLTYGSNPNSQTDVNTIKDIRALLQKISAKGYGSYISSVVASAAEAEIQTDIDNGRIAFDVGHENDKAGIVKGVIVRCASKGGEAVTIDPQLLVMISQIARNFKINISSIVGCHSQSATIGKNMSQHWTGHAVDINYVDGVHVAPGSDKAKQLMKWLQTNNNTLGFQVFQTIGPTDMTDLQIRRCKNASGNGITDSGHNNHVHIGVYQTGNTCQ